MSVPGNRAPHVDAPQGSRGSNDPPVAMDVASEESAPADLEIDIPDRLRAFWAGEWKTYEKKLAYDLPYWSGDCKFKLGFTNGGMDLFEDNDVDPDDYEETWLPFSYLAPFDEDEEEDEGYEDVISEFLAVNVSDPACPIGMWSHETGMFEEYRASLDDFLQKLLSPGERTPVEQLQSDYDRAKEAFDNEQWTEVLEALEPILAAFGVQQPKFDGYQGYLPGGFNLQGLSLKQLGRKADAIQAFRNSAECGGDHAVLNIMSLLEDDEDFEALIEEGEKLRDSYLAEYTWYWVRRYLGRTYVRVGDAEKSEAIYRQLLERYGEPDRDPEQFDELTEDLTEWGDKPNGKLAKQHLTWFKRKSYDDLSPEENEANRLWWESLPGSAEFWQPFFKEALGLDEDESPTDAQIAQILDLKDLDIDEEHNVSDVTPLAAMKRLESLELHGDIDSLEPLRGITTLDDVEVNGDVVKDLKLPNPWNKRLYAAVEEGDLEKIQIALDKGANIGTRNIIGSGVLHAAVMNHQITDDEQIQLAIFLMDQGADLYAENEDGSNALEYCDPETAKRLEEEFKARGGATSDSPFRVLTDGRHQNAPSLDSIDGYDDDWKLSEGLPLKEEVPDTVSVQWSTDYPGYMKDTVLCDYFESYGVPIVSEKLAAFLQEQDPNVELISITMRDHKENPVDAAYFILNPAAQDCLDVEASVPSYSHISGDIDKVEREVFDESRLPEHIAIFRIKDFSEPVVFRKELAEAIESEGFTNIAFRKPRR